ncbi:Protein of unknown function [Thermobacillus xylanilyticus]|jgi:hypothetical protein|uniref:DUF4064 domain-containing protein n=1 Tax=Thermobacillus xylanilyticus TaxID=76633 RepID=A0ABM8V423_THEXY|nr:hypothetical protein [Thermobacillus xylanilyticus]CAG5086190.1 Protein of unknown function [Thermobacillus xylanilyticus]
MSRKTGFAGVLAGCAGSACLLYAGLASSGSGDDSVLMVAYGILSLLAFLLSAYYLKKANGKGVLYCGAALTLFSVLGMMSVGLVLLPGSLLIFIPSAIHRLEHRE